MSEPAPASVLDSSAVQTVVDLAAHLKRLQVHAIELQSQFTASDRGYFTPSEDEQVERLWVSYHKSRSALYETIHTVQESVGNSTGKHLGEFAIAYAAVLALVDTARWLRSLFADHALLRRKLNESFALYGIAADSFDAIQLSLTNPSNALQIKQANEFYDGHCDALHGLADHDEGLQSVITVIESLRESTQVPVHRYVKARLADRRHQAREQVIKGNVARAVYKIQEFGSRIVSCVSTKPRHVSRLPDAITEGLIQILKPGDVLVTRKDTALTNYFLPGFWPHAALYVGDMKVVEALKDGVRERSLDSPFGNDALAVIRPRLDQEAIHVALQRARVHVGKPYDFDFDFTRADRMVCTEVVYRSYEGVGGIEFQLKRRAGRETLAAEDLLQLALQQCHFDQVSVYCAKFGEQLHEGEKMTEIIRQTIAS